MMTDAASLPSNTRIIQLGEQQLQITESTGLENEAGAVIWDAGLVLSHFILEQQESLQLPGKQVLELGSGTGVSGLTAALLGATVTLTDLPHLLPTLRQNIEDNSLQSRARALALDWTNPACYPECQPDLILASDVIYERDSVAPLFRAIRGLSRPSTLTLLAIEVRENIHSYALEQLRESGLSSRQIPASEMHEDWQADDIQLYELRLP